MSLLNTTTLQVKRYGRQAINEAGEVVVTASTTLTIKCNYQPVPTATKGEVAKVLPSGVSIDDVLVLFTKADLQTDKESNGTTGDEVIIGGAIYKVLQERDWSRYLSIKHREYLLVRKTKT